MGGDGVLGRWLVDRCSDRDLHGRGPDCCGLQRGKKPSLDISNTAHCFCDLTVCLLNTLPSQEKKTVQMYV